MGGLPAGIPHRSPIRPTGVKQPSPYFRHRESGQCGLGRPAHGPGVTGRSWQLLPVAQALGWAALTLQAQESQRPSPTQVIPSISNLVLLASHPVSAAGAQCSQLDEEAPGPGAQPICLQEQAGLQGPFPALWKSRGQPSLSGSCIQRP